MHERREGRTSVGGPVLLIMMVLLSIAVCRRDSARETLSEGSGPAAVLSVPVPPPFDRALDDRFAFAGGLSVESPSYAAWLEEASWKDFSALTGEAWVEFDSAVLQPMKAWAREALWEINEYPAALFYPFGGPDFATAFALFPGATKTILMGLEPVGNLPDFERTTAEWRGEFFADLGTLVSGFLKRGYFITMDMMDVYTRGKVEGALPVIGFFLKRGGCSVVGVRRLVPDGSGGWIETPYERLANRPRRPYGVKIDYLGPGDTAPRSVYYFSCDLENQAFAEESALHRFFEGLGTMTTFVKSGSYLLHWSNFSTVRKLILERSLFVLQDDTAIPYRFFKSRDWDIRLFGRYTTPVKDFTNVEQLDLRAAYEDPDVSVKPLSFHFGYRWVTQVDNLLLAKRPRRPYKVPVIK